MTTHLFGTHPSHHSSHRNVFAPVELVQLALRLFNCSKGVLHQVTHQMTWMKKLLRGVRLHITGSYCHEKWAITKKNNLPLLAQAVAWHVRGSTYEEKNKQIRMRAISNLKIIRSPLENPLHCNFFF